MKKPINSQVIADLALLLAKYDAEQLRNAMSILMDAEKVIALRDLIVQASAKASASRVSVRDNPDDKWIADLIAARPQEAVLIKKVVKLLMAAKWSSIESRLRSLTNDYGLAPIDGATSKERKIQMSKLLMMAPTSLLSDIVREFMERGVKQRSSQVRNSLREKEAPNELEELDFRVDALVASRPEESERLEKIVRLIRSTRWATISKRLRSLTDHFGVQPISGKSDRQRSEQLMRLLEVAPVELLDAIVRELTPEVGGDGTLQQWSNIILRDRKLK